MKKKIPTNNLSLFEATCKLLLSQRLQGRWRTSTDLSRSQALSSYTEVLKKEYLQPRLPWQDAMISAIADTCSVRLDKTNKKVYRFRALVFHQGKPYCTLTSVNVACVAGAWKQWVQERTSAREGDTFHISWACYACYSQCRLRFSGCSTRLNAFQSSCETGFSMD